MVANRPAPGVEAGATATGWTYKMHDDAILDEFRQAEALLEGHFILSSGLRSSRYLQCARVLMDPKRGQRLCDALVSRLPAGLRESTS